MNRIHTSPGVAQHSPQATPQRRNLDRWALAALDGRHTYSTHYAAACAVAAHALARGWDMSSLWERFEGLARQQAKADKRTPNKRRVDRFVVKAWTYAQQHRRSQADPFTVRAAVSAAREHAGRARFTGRQHSLALVLEAVLDAAEQQRTISPSVAVRSLEIATGLGKSTAARALQRLVQLDYLQQVSKSNGESASTYRLRHTEPMVGLSGTVKVFPGGTKGLSHLRTATELAREDAFRALGRTAARVLAALDELEELTPQALALHTGLAAATARKALRDLEAVGLAQRHRKGRGYAWTARLDVLTPETLTRIALDYGTHGHRERRERIITEQRDRWEKWNQQKAEALERQRWKYRSGHALARLARAAA